MQSVSLAKLGYSVKAIDFNRQLLSELQHNCHGLEVEVIEDDIRSFTKYANPQPGLVTCCGDTILHLESRDDVNRLIRDCAGVLAPGGKLVLSFRDYSNELSGGNRFIPVKSDENRILTCCLDYGSDKLLVTDLFHFRVGNGWQQKVSSYYKLRIVPDEIADMITQNGLKISSYEIVNGFVTIIAELPHPYL